MAHTVKVSAEEKVRIAEAYLSGKIGSAEASVLAGVDAETIRRWVSRYKAEGPTGFLTKARNRNYSKGMKLEAVMDYFAGKGSLQQICERYQLRSITQLRNWLKMYNRHEDFKELSGGSRMTKGRETTQEERVEIARECIASGNTYGTAALKYEVSYQQVYTWVRKYRAMGEVGLEDRRGHRAGTLPGRTPDEKLRDRVAQLERKNFDLEMENALLKKVKELERRRR